MTVWSCSHLYHDVKLPCNAVHLVSSDWWYNKAPEEILGNLFDHDVAAHGVADFIDGHEQKLAEKVDKGGMYG